MISSQTNDCLCTLHQCLSHKTTGFLRHYLKCDFTRTIKYILNLRGGNDLLHFSNMNNKSHGVVIRPPDVITFTDIAEVHMLKKDALHYTTQHYTTLQYNTIHCTPLHYTTLHYTTLHYTTIRCTTLH